MPNDIFFNKPLRKHLVFENIKSVVKEILTEIKLVDQDVCIRFSRFSKNMIRMTVVVTYTTS